MKKILLSLLLSSLFLAACTKVEEPPVVIEEPKPTAEEIQAQREAQHQALEAQRKLDLVEFYVPLPGLNDVVELETVVAKGLYITANVAGFDFVEADIDAYIAYIQAQAQGQTGDEASIANVNKLERILAMAQATEINTLVIDVKNDLGLVTWDSDIAIVDQIGSNWETSWRDPSKLLSYLDAKNIYTIARIVAFKDPYFAKKFPEHAIQLLSGGVYLDKAGYSWVNPFDEYVWNYLIAVAQEAALRGFDEIQYDYVRFPDNAKYYNPITEFPGRNVRDKDEAIEQFLQKAQIALEPYKVHVAADVFGVITHSWEDQPEDIGQTWLKIAQVTDYICPMVYPSHYGVGFYGYDVPDAHPYEIIRMALQEGLERSAAQNNPSVIRSWIQGFTANWVKGYIEYDSNAIKAQIRALNSLGLEEYIIWQSSNIYEFEAYLPDTSPIPSQAEGVDILDRRPEEALKRYLEAQLYQRYNHLYLLTPIQERAADYDQFYLEETLNNPKLTSYEIVSVQAQSDGTYLATVNAKLVSDLGQAVLENATYTIRLENRVYKISAPEIQYIKES